MNHRVPGAESLELFLKTACRVEGGLTIAFCPPSRNWLPFFRNRGAQEIRVAAFGRNSWPIYLLAGWFLRLLGRGHQLLLVDDGLLSSLFFADRSEGYRAFSARHLPRRRGWRRKLRRLAPLSLRAAVRYLAVGVPKDPPAWTGRGNLQKPFDFLFYSNQEGKHLFLATADLVRGRGVVGKTAWNPTALEVAAREFSIMEFLSGLNSKTSSAPCPAGLLEMGGRNYYLEEYIGGTTLRDVLTDPYVCHDRETVQGYLNRQDRWFAGYRRSFEGTLQPLSAFYAPLFARYQKHWPAETQVHTFNRQIGAKLDELSVGHTGLIPVIAHNDLWPGNFIVHEDRLVVVDWERSCPESAYIFDYFWMVISTAIEVYMAQKGFHDYSRGFRAFLSSEELICRDGRERLNSFLTELHLEATLLRMFLYLFLLEWSVQGANVFGHTTPMDELAHGELKHFLLTHGPLLEGNPRSPFE